jgi:hypothetical protein
VDAFRTSHWNHAGTGPSPSPAAFGSVGEVSVLHARGPSPPRTAPLGGAGRCCVASFARLSVRAPLEALTAENRGRRASPAAAAAAAAAVSLQVNPQWKTKGNLVSDFGFGPWKQRAEDFVRKFTLSYSLQVSGARVPSVVIEA